MEREPVGQVSPRLAPTKIRPPALGDSLAPRRRIGELLDRASRVAVVVAPAGYGKTIAVAQWVARRQDPVAWFTIDEHDRTAARFWRYVAAAFGRAVRTLGDETIGAIDDWAVDGVDMASVLLAELGEDRPPMVVVFDDVHHITEPAIMAELAFFLERAPAWLHVVLITRSVLPLPIARWRAQGVLTEIRQSDLALLPDEAHEMIRGTPFLQLDPSTEERLIGLTRGWPTAIQLAMLALRGRDDADRFVREDLAGDRMLFDYVVGEVLDRLTADDRRAVLALSVLDDIDPQRCEHLLDCEDGETLLMRLVRLGLPIVPLEAGRRTFRFHELFRDLVQYELRLRDAPMVAELHRRAATAERASGDDPAAVRHLLAAGDQQEAFEVVFGPVWHLYRSGATRELAMWLDQFPADFVGSDPGRIIAFATALALVARLDDASRWNELAAALITDDEELLVGLALSRMLVDMGRGDTGAVRSAVAELSATAYEREIRDDPTARVSTIAAIIELLDEAIDEAERWVAAIVACPTPAERLRVVGVPARKAWLAFEHGELDEARSLAELSLTGVGSEGRGAANAIIELFMVESMVATEHLELDDADTWADRAIEQATMLGAPIYIFLARSCTLAAMEARSGAVAALSDALQFAASPMPDAMRPRYGLVLAELAARAERWADCEQQVADLPDSDRRRVVEARLAIHRRQPAVAIGLLDEVSMSTRPLRRQIEAELLRHLCRPGETAHLQQALELGAGKGFAASYIREGVTVTTPLRRLVDADPRWRSSVLAAGLRSQPAADVPDRYVIIEPLSAKEREVLQLLPTHLSTVEIAQRMFVSANTVRTHIKAIYRKLDVRSRSEVVRRADALGLTTVAASPHPT